MVQNLLCVRVPAYNDLSLNHPVSVCLYVSNGKRKRSSTHCFKYLPSECYRGSSELCFYMVESLCTWY